ncbi:hypothetical protein FMM05_10760 [Flavobacterium zepuense]|uniref:Uncharacterized protein n=1 Tax=Flavobacterium zepuense TaxID=2593302 RepID=A0A552V1H2_9FLAO|nr:hypothetical protein [Flavobacterium zepuense]TRW24305.1 hypothetical protein FMM05_10760 [Flavobacterium zepuense]
MKNILTLLIFIASFTLNAQEINKATIFKSDSIIYLNAVMRLDHKIVGYEKPDAKSRKMILLSIFTSDVENNPYNCPFGAYYDTTHMDGLTIKCLATQDNFIKAALLNDNQTKAVVYFEKNWVEWQED